jgi:serine protease Do
MSLLAHPRLGREAACGAGPAGGSRSRIRGGQLDATRGANARQGWNGRWCLGVLLLSGLLWDNCLVAQERLPAASDAELIIGAERLSEAFRLVAKRLKPSVVTITSSIEIDPRQLRGRGLEGLSLPPGLEDLLPEELREQLPRGRGDTAPRDEGRGDSKMEKVQTGTGSGVIVSADGFILTNNHVVAESDTLQVELNDGRIFAASVIGSDTASDVAVLKVEASGLVAAALGDSTAMEVGDWVLAIGSPFGLDQTVTAGIISATHRQTGIIQGGYEDFLQTDAAINPGNSGGPLVSLRGEVIGINTAINSRSGTNAGVGFAIPANMARRIMEDLQREGRVVRGFLGASLDDVTMEKALRLQLPPGVIRGALITGVSDGEPAARANLQPNDVVVAVNETAITSLFQLRNMVALSRPGSQMLLDVFRGGTKMQVEVVVGELTPEKLAAMVGRTEISEMGMVVQRLTPQLAEELGADANTEGAVVTEVSPDGDAVQLRLRPGDIIVRINETNITSPAQLKTVLTELTEFTLVVQRGNRLLSIRVQRR